jgi:hypothetical protein
MRGVNLLMRRLALRSPFGEWEKTTGTRSLSKQRG